MVFLNYENAKEYLKKSVTKKEWDDHRPESSDKGIKKEIKKYMSFAWEKANDCRGISANRSMDNMTAWLWLLNNTELTNKFEETEYEHYGKEKLIVVCEHLKIDWKKLDNGIRTNFG